ncbi:hypothetical protein J3B02_001243 [Coemansia erecta]|uniref:Uncharacterized protein n=1 Tax=Coemansia asiatica TaxID=1052880 RepID=A0A9W7XG32_9FUNG|nr:hypothetical protein LPJ64_005635 [Coemansia asiatica]KAJ2857075.1 hypothetical protein J3B02_001243 [Coemansia erecta]KAJ2887762.1 hypothetical protein FB639_001091 [Coemansia asiatica]
MSTSSSDISAKYHENSSQFTTSSPATNVLKLFGPPKLMGNDLDNLVPVQSPGGVNVMPGIAMGGDTSVSANQDSSGEHQQNQYYLAYDDKDKILWFQVQVNPNGEEVLSSHGWKVKQ